jgi:hypothetical protein
MVSNDLENGKTIVPYEGIFQKRRISQVWGFHSSDYQDYGVLE